MRRYVSHFQPSFKLLEKIREGATVVKRYSPPAAPCDRRMQHDTVNEETKEAMRQRRAMLDPVALLHTIGEAQSALTAVSSPQLRETPQGESLEPFRARLPSLWRQGEERSTHAAGVRGPRHWRTRKDPKLNAYLAMRPDQALADARAAQEAVDRGDTLGPLHGIPISIKDLEATKDMNTTI